MTSIEGSAITALAIQVQFRKYLALRKRRYIAFQHTWDILDAAEEHQAILASRSNFEKDSFYSLLKKPYHCPHYAINDDNGDVDEDDEHEDAWFKRSQDKKLLCATCLTEEEEEDELHQSYLSMMSLSSDTEYDPVNYTRLDIENLSSEKIAAMKNDFTIGNKILHPEDALRLVQKTTDILECLPTVVDLSVPDNGSMIVVGDIHGQYQDLSLIFSQNGFPTDSNNCCYLFNGDFVDRGPSGCETLFTMYALKLLYPNRIHLNRGNHENQSLNERYGFEQEVHMKYSGRIYSEILRSFDALPLAAVIESSIFVVHGGLSHVRGVKLNDFRNINRFEVFLNPHPKDLHEILADSALWSDPDDTIKGYKTNPRGAGVRFGSLVSQTFLQENNLSKIIRSHELKREGYECVHDNNVITVFSASNYCNKSKNFGAVLKIKKIDKIDLSPRPGSSLSGSFMQVGTDKKLSFSFHRYRISSEQALALTNARIKMITSKAYPEYSRSTEEETLELLRTRIYTKRHELLTMFNDTDSSREGVVSVWVWVKVLNSCIELEDIPWFTLRPFLVDTSVEGLITYAQFCRRYRLRFTESFQSRWSRRVIRGIGEKIFSYRQSLEEVFKEVDLNGDGKISYPELLVAMGKLKLGLTDNQMFDLTRVLANYLEKDRHYNLYGGVSLEAFCCIWEPVVLKLFRNMESYEDLVRTETSYDFHAWEMYELARRNYEIHSDQMKAHFTSSGAYLTLDQLLNFIRVLCPGQPEGDIKYLAKSILLYNNKDTITLKEFEEVMEIGVAYEDDFDDWKIELLDQVASILFGWKVHLKRAFTFFDKSGDGLISVKEFNRALASLDILSDHKLSSREVSLVHKLLDINQDGSVNIEEFLNCFSVVDMNQTSILL